MVHHTSPVSDVESHAQVHAESHKVFLLFNVRIHIHVDAMLRYRGSERVQAGPELPRQHSNLLECHPFEIVSTPAHTPLSTVVNNYILLGLLLILRFIALLFLFLLLFFDCCWVCLGLGIFRVLVSGCICVLLFLFLLLVLLLEFWPPSQARARRKQFKEDTPVVLHRG